MSEMQASYKHVFRYEQQIPAEHQILSRLVKPGMRVLDVGTAATGRSARLLRDLGCEVVSIEINEAAIQEFNRHEDKAGIELATADLVSLPFSDQSFDLILVAFHGLDYLIEERMRLDAFRQVDRLLRPGGAFVFNGFNRVGILFTPQGLFSRYLLKLRLKHILRGRFLTRTLIDVNKLELHQAAPRYMINQVEGVSSLHFDYATDHDGSTQNLTQLTLFTTAPYYVFSK